MQNKKCLKCEKEFTATNTQLKLGWGKYCSRNCSNKHNRRRGEQLYNWKGDSVGYYALHDWLILHYGKAKKCEMCGGTSRVQWAKLRNKLYERRRENFWNLCHKCHMEYDGTSIASRPTWNKGRSWTKDERLKISRGTKLGMAKLK